jgi:Zn-dependent alcohol dehydrogenase
VDPVESKRDWAKIFGATHTAASAQEAIPLIREITAGLMADRVIVTPGVVHVDLIPLAMTLLRKGGVCVLTGITPYTEPPVPLVLQEMVLSAKQLRGALYGGMNPRTSVPLLLSLYQAGALKLDELITRHYQLDEINEAMADLREGRNIRGVIDFAGR